MTTVNPSTKQPAAAQSAAGPAPDTIYMVVNGDTLSKIAQRFYGDPQQYPKIAQANGLDPSAVLSIGQRLRIPGATAAQGTPGAAPPTVAPSTPPTQVVQPGFTALSLNDWRVWAGVGLVGLAIYLLARRR